MPTPFPGMDPYLERPSMWPGVHNALMAAIQLDLAPQVRPRYYVSLEDHIVQFLICLCILQKL